MLVCLLGFGLRCDVTGSIVDCLQQMSAPEPGKHRSEHDPVEVILNNLFSSQVSKERRKDWAVCAVGVKLSMQIALAYQYLL
jgi:hypothetical protein